VLFSVLAAGEFSPSSYSSEGFKNSGSRDCTVAVGINWEGRRNVLAIELTSRESTSSWKELLLGLRKRSLSGVEFVVSDDHAELRRAIRRTGSSNRKN